MSASVTVRSVQKVFALSETGGGPVSLREALRAGKKAEAATREIRALDDVSFSIGMGERIGIIGRNGAGKTTLLSLLAGITQPTSGTVEVVGDVHAMLTIGAVLRDEATGRENIYLDGAVHGLSREHIDTLVENIIAFTELGEFIDRPVRTYSSGMKGRLAFALGAFVEPEILIIDETLSVGDAIFARKATQRMKEMTATGKIVIVVSHALSTIDRICSRCIWLDGGRVMMDGPATEVTAAYAAAVDHADEQELMRKFGSGDPVARRPQAGQLQSLTLTQTGKDIGPAAKALVPLAVDVCGTLDGGAGAADIELSLMRVDGKAIWTERLSGQGGTLPAKGPFRLRVLLKPFLLSSHLYRLTALLSDSEGPIDTRVKVFEVIDEEGYAGGVPMLNHEPSVTVRPVQPAVAARSAEETRE